MDHFSQLYLKCFLLEDGKIAPLLDGHEEAEGCQIVMLRDCQLLDLLWHIFKAADWVFESTRE